MVYFVLIAARGEDFLGTELIASWKRNWSSLPRPEDVESRVTAYPANQCPFTATGKSDHR